MNETFLHFILFLVGGMVGFMTAAIVTSNKMGSMLRRVHELEHEVKTLQQRGRKPQAKKKPARRRNA